MARLRTVVLPHTANLQKMRLSAVCGLKNNFGEPSTGCLCGLYFLSQSNSVRSLPPPGSEVFIKKYSQKGPATGAPSHPIVSAELFRVRDKRTATCLRTQPPPPCFLETAAAQARDRRARGFRQCTTAEAGLRRAPTIQNGLRA